MEICLEYGIRNVNNWRYIREHIRRNKMHGREHRVIKNQIHVGGNEKHQKVVNENKFKFKQLLRT